MTEYAIQHPEADTKFWSLYGWAPILQAMRFRTDDDAKQFRDTHGLYGARVLSAKFDDNRRPDITSDYNPFGSLT